MAAALELFPIFAHASLLRTWGGVVDVCPDASPIIGPHADRRALPQLRLGYGRLQGDPGLGVGLRGDDRERRADASSPTVLARAVHDRALIDEHGAAAVAH